jgi:hypothetical protein
MLKQLFYRVDRAQGRLRGPGSPDLVFAVSFIAADHSGKSALLEIAQICLDHPGNSLYNFDAVHESGKKPITSG